MSLIVRAKKLSKFFPSGDKILTVLEDLDLEVKAGEFISIVGASGVGKTTLLQILGTLEEPTSGEVYLEEKLVSKRTESFLAVIRREKIGFLFQFHNLMPEFTALENILLAGMIAKQKKTQLREKTEELLKQVGLLERANHFPTELSGGERQRVALIRALINQPRLILMDEPTGNLDTKSSEEVINLIKYFQKEEKMAIIMATHNFDLAKEADNLFYLYEGKLHKQKKNVEKPIIN